MPDRTNVMERGLALSWPRVALVVLVAWWTLRAMAWAWIFLDFVNLAFHEAGHLFLSFGGSTLHYLGGSIGQLLVPALLLYHFLFRQRQPIGGAFCVWWFGQSLTNIAVYMADARDLALPLVGGGDHDWNELFFRFGLLAEDSVRLVSGITHAAGVVVMLLGLAWCSYLALPLDRRRSVGRLLVQRFPWLAEHP